ncbi:MAG: TetR/AcrR family transcriptional regulator [Rhodobacteraceae bacterium]|nr:TetR/AcrR family transcriptional regulator [Paracoccaceae bacterium]
MTDQPPLPDARAVEILERVKAVFAQKGFDGASMQDLARAAGMSAGNFYRYFPSKDAIVESLVQRDLSEVGTIFTHIMAAPNPRAAFLQSLRHELSQQGDCDGPLWAEIEAASIRKPEIGAISRRMENEVERYLLRVFACIAGVPEPEAAARFATHARLCVILFKGVAMQPAPDPALIELTIGTMDRMLDTMLAPALSPSPLVSAAE